MAFAAASSASADAAAPPRRISRPSEASPIVPVAMTRSPGFAPLRRTILPDGTRPNAVIEIITGPGVETVSPPSSGQPNRPASSPSDRAKGAGRASSAARSASVSTKPAGVAPLAARSDRFTRSALRAIVSGGSSLRKCTPSTMASVVTTTSSPRAFRIAASSTRLNAPGSVASGLKYRAISVSSPDGRALATGKLVGAKLPRDLVEHGVDHAGLVAIDKGVRDIDIFRDHDAAGHILAMLEFIGARAQHRAQVRVDPFQRPALRQRVVNHRIKLGLVAHHAGDDVAKECGFGRQIFVAFDLASEPMAFELGKAILDARPGG